MCPSLSTAEDQMNKKKLKAAGRKGGKSRPSLKQGRKKKK